MNGRICAECGSTKTQTAASRGRRYDKWYSDGKGGYLCKKCGVKAYYLKNHEKWKEYGRQYMKEYAKLHPENNWQKANPDKANAYHRAYRKAHPEKFREYERRRRARQIA